MNDRDTPERLARYLDRLALLTGATPAVHEVSPPGHGLGRVTAATYVDVPEPGYVTGFTYGLSLASHPEWGSGRRELSITVRSPNVEWAIVPSKAVDAMREVSSFSTGRAIGYKARFVDDSGMSSLLVASSTMPWNSTAFSLSSDEAEVDMVEIVGSYPIYALERVFVMKRGLEEFWNLDWDRFDPLRPLAIEFPESLDARERGKL